MQKRVIVPMLLAGALCAGSLDAGTVIERWSVTERGVHPKTLAIVKADGLATIRVDLAALPAGAKIHRARLLAERDELRGGDPRVRQDIGIIPADGGTPLGPGFGAGRPAGHPAFAHRRRR